MTYHKKMAALCAELKRLARKSGIAIIPLRAKRPIDKTADFVWAMPDPERSMARFDRRVKIEKARRPMPVTTFRLNVDFEAMKIKTEKQCPHHPGNYMHDAGCPECLEAKES